MNIPNLTFNQFCLLPSDEQTKWTTIILASENIDVDCRQWKFGRIKELQTMLSKPFQPDFFNEILKDVLTDYGNFPFHVVLKTFNGIMDSLKAITEIENKSLSTQLKSDEVSAMEAVGGFDRFGKFPQILDLCDGDITKYDAIYNTKWELAFSTLLYRKTQYDYQKELYKKK